ncbi:hemerythrin domain-containing protein [Undibacterium sp. Di24W]|uniref:hemerythrin domain-containing protein n=1 Tax=Undibacterium sp. Di24W TaxID=3413033 RepID=UPI003BEF4FD7
MTKPEWTWSDRLSLKHEVMDETHQEFVALCAALSLNEPATYLSRLDALINHSVEHFTQEDRWMRETNFPPAGCHQGEHDAVLQVMQEVRRRYAAGEHDLGASLAEELPLWFEHHVATMDNMLAQFLISNEISAGKLSEEKAALV